MTQYPLHSLSNDAKELIFSYIILDPKELNEQKLVKEDYEFIFQSTKFLIINEENWKYWYQFIFNWKLIESSELKSEEIEENDLTSMNLLLESLPLFKKLTRLELDTLIIDNANQISSVVSQLFYINQLGLINIQFLNKDTQKLFEFLSQTKIRILKIEWLSIDPISFYKLLGSPTRNKISRSNESNNFKLFTESDSNGVNQKHRENSLLNESYYIEELNLESSLIGNLELLFYENKESVSFNIYNSIKHLNIRGNSIGTKIASLLLETLSKNSVQHLNLCCCELDDNFIYSINNFITYNKSLIELDISINNLSDINLGGLHLSILQVLNLSSNRINSTLIHSLIHSIKFSSLKTLKLDDNHINSNGVQLLIKALSDTSIIELSLSRNYIDDESFNFLSNSREILPLQKLNLSNNKISSHGFYLLIQWQLIQPNMNFIDLSRNLIQNIDIDIVNNSFVQKSYEKLESFSSIEPIESINSIKSSRTIKKHFKIDIAYNIIPKHCVESLNHLAGEQIIGLDKQNFKKKEYFGI